MIKIANAPCSWGVIENTPGERSGYGRFLDEMRETGYAGTELGDWGFMPTEPQQLESELSARKLQLVASWVSVRLYDESYHTRGVEAAIRTANLLAEVGGPENFIVIGDDHSTIAQRHDNSGRITPTMGLDEAGWQIYAAGINKVATAVKNETGLRSVLHHHGATFVETPAEVSRVLSLTDPDLVGLCFDTGHYHLGGGDAVEGITAFADRIWHVHFKDFTPSVLAQADDQGWGYQQLIANGMFCELGTGVVDFPAILKKLKGIGYEGWIVVEQDVWPGLGNPKENAARNRAYIQSLGL